MFAKGPMPREESYKDLALAIEPGLKCYRDTRMGITGYIISLNGKDIYSKGSASKVWEEAYCDLKAKEDAKK